MPHQLPRDAALEGKFMTRLNFLPKVGESIDYYRKLDGDKVTGVVDAIDVERMIIMIDNELFEMVQDERFTK